MSEIALAKINSFAHGAQQADVSPEESVFVLTGSQLQEIISQEVLETTKSLNSRIDALEDRIIKQDEKIRALEATQDTQGENELNMLRLINDLRKDHEPGPQTKDRVDILRALLAANNGKLLEKDARQKMHLSRSQFSKLLDHAHDYVVVKPYHLKRNQKILVQIVSGNKKQD
jgi:hypothetical protein